MQRACILFAILFFLFSSSVVAQEYDILLDLSPSPTPIVDDGVLKNSEFILELNTPEKSPAQSPTPTPKYDPLSPSQRRIFDARGYIASTTGDTDTDEIIFSLSHGSVSFDTELQTPLESKTTIRLVSPKSYHYWISATMAQPLSSERHVIPWTTCDSSRTPCTALVARPWTNPKTYGFGYSLAGQDIPSDFSDKTYYRIFDPETFTTIARGKSKKGLSQQDLSFKLVKQPTTTSGIYTSSLQLFILPTL